MSFRIDATSIAAPVLAVPSAGPVGGGTFANSLAGAIGDVEQSQQNAQTAAAGLLAGGSGDVHNVALTAQRAELSLELFQQMRNKIVQAYQEIMKLQM